MINKDIYNFIGSILGGIGGLIFIIKHKSLGTKTALFWCKTMKVTPERHLQFNERMAQIGFLTVGIIFIFFAIMILYQNFK